MGYGKKRTKACAPLGLAKKARLIQGLKGIKVSGARSLPPTVRCSFGSLGAAVGWWAKCQSGSSV